MTERFDARATLERLIPPLHPDAWRIIPIFLVVALLLFWLWTPLGWVGIGFTVWCATLFREPPRTAPLRSALAVSPVDGVVVEIGSAPLPREFGFAGPDRFCLCIAIGPWDSHILRAPGSGKLTALTRLHSGRGGESAALRLAGDSGEIFVIATAAGMGRRIGLDVAEGAELAVGQRAGVVLFAGHVEVFLDLAASPQVTVGQRMVAGETILAADPAGLSRAAGG